MDAATFIATSVLLTIGGLIVLYFVIKNAVKNALIEDRAFQAKVEKLKQQNAADRAPR